jgi:hypothetical protein
MKHFSCTELALFGLSLRDTITWAENKVTAEDWPDFSNPLLNEEGKEALNAGHWMFRTISGKTRKEPYNTDWCRTPELDPTVPVQIGCDAVIQKRRKLLKVKGFRPYAEPILKARGQLLLTSFQARGQDKLNQINPSLLQMQTGTQSLSGGFYDASDCPPWDLWVACPSTILISWIPEPWIDIANIAMDACFLENVRWLSSAQNDPLLKQLKEHHYVE